VTSIEAAELRRIDYQWKSDVDLKLDKLLKFAELMATREQTLTREVAELNEVLNAAKGSLAALYVVAKASGAVAVIVGAVYAVKEWIIRR